MEVFDFQGYKAYLLSRLSERGGRSRLSRAIGCQTAYTAQVLRGAAHFSLEQGEAINEFFGHTPEEGHYFLLLILHDRAGSAKLRKRFRGELEATQRTRLALKNRLGVQSGLTLENQTTYYSSWHFAAMHALASVPGFQNSDTIARRLRIGRAKAARALDFLLRCGLLKQEGDRLQVGLARLHLPHDSPLIARHHINWRLQAVRSLEQESEESLHYSSVVSLSRDDAAKIREKLVKMLAEIKPVIRDSKEEMVSCLALDFFEA